MKERKAEVMKEGPGFGERKTKNEKHIYKIESKDGEINVPPKIWLRFEEKEVQVP